MKLWEAMKALEEGKKIRKDNWDLGEYVYKNEYGNYITNEGIYFDIIRGANDNNWEIYNDRKECLEIFKELYEVLNRAYVVHYNGEDYDEYDEYIIESDDTDYINRLHYQLKEMNKHYKLDK